MLHVRPATLSDTPHLARIYAHAVLHGTASFEIEPPDEREMQRRYEAVVGAGYPYLVADDGSRVLGYAYANAYRLRPAYRHAVENSIYVAADAHRRGVGQALLSALLDQCTSAGYRQMIAVIGDSANHASIGLHRRNGFHFSGTIHDIGFKHGRWLDSVIMQKALGEGARTPPA